MLRLTDLLPIIVVTLLLVVVPVQVRWAMPLVIASIQARISEPLGMEGR